MLAYLACDCDCDHWWRGFVGWAQLVNKWTLITFLYMGRQVCSFQTDSTHFWTLAIWGGGCRGSASSRSTADNKIDRNHKLIKGTPLPLPQPLCSSASPSLSLSPLQPTCQKPENALFNTSTHTMCLQKSLDLAKPLKITGNFWDSLQIQLMRRLGYPAKNQKMSSFSDFRTRGPGSYIVTKCQRCWVLHWRTSDVCFRCAGYKNTSISG